MARTRWFLRYASRIAFFSLLGAAAIALVLLLTVAACVQPHASCALSRVSLAVPLFGAALGLLLVGWGTLADLLIFTQNRRKRAASWVAGTPDPKQAISTGGLAVTLVATASAWVAGSLVSNEVGLAFASSFIVLGFSIQLLPPAFELLPVRGLKVPRPKASLPAPSEANNGQAAALDA